MMKSVQFKAAGEPAEVLEVVEIPIPDAGAGEIRIKVLARNINPSDIMFVRGLYGIMPQYPSSAGFEAVGTVDANGEGVDMEVGTRVIFSAVGTWQEFVVVPAKTVIPAPVHMPDEVACQAFVNPFTAYAMVQESGLQAGQYLLITAGGSAFGKMVLSVCKKKGIHTICTVRRDDQKGALKALGATEVVNTETEKLAKRVHEISQGKGADCCFDAVGGKLGAQALNSLAYKGTMYVFGLLSLENIPLNSGIMIFKSLVVKGFWLSDWMANLTKERRMEAVKEVLTMLTTAEMPADVEARYTLDEVKKAVVHADAPGRTGKIILVNN